MRIYLDISEPIGGFLPFDERERSGFKPIVQSLPGYLTEAFGGSRPLHLQWRGVSDQQPADLPAPKITRNLFQGRESRLDLAIQAMTKDVQGGADVAVLITDLVATGPLIGAMGVANALDPTFAQAVQSGRYELGLLGVRAPYWGVRSKHCRASTAGLGCWFSELKPGYQPLTHPAKVPFYVFLIGRSGGGVERVGRSLQQIASGLETRWELLSRAAYLPGLELGCKAALLTEDGRETRRRQTALFADPAGFRCQRDEKVELVCGLQDPSFNVVGATWAASGTAKSPWREAVRFASRPRDRDKDRTDLAMTIDCDKLPGHRTLPEPPPFRMELHRPLLPPWDDWSSESDERETDLGKTLQLKLFVEKARLAPPSYSVLCGPLHPSAPPS
ncbi:MAG TPA: hypothetical protein VFE33_28100 [Thermoanaerobaculia bacterium]|nr:hypothetical protein [Thermoanaerobaculia bacterium]